MKVAVLGGSGFVGQHVCRTLRSSGATVKTFDRRSGCDLLNLEAASASLASFRPQYVVNCAAMVGSIAYVSDRAADIVDINMRMLLNVYKIARQLPETVIINPIANCAYPGAKDIFEESGFWDGPVHASVLSYGSTRRMMRVLSECYAAQYGVRSVNLAVPNMYGPLDSTDPRKTHALNALVIKFVRAVKDELPEVEVWGTGKPVREWLYAPDFAGVVHRTVDSRVTSLDLVNVGQRQGYSVREIVDVIREAVGYRGKIVYNKKYPDGAASKVMGDRLFRAHFPDFQFTSLSDGVAATIRYYQSVLA